MTRPKSVTTSAEAIRQTRPFRSPRQEGVVALLLAADAVRGSIARVLEPFAITPQQYNVLRILRGAGAGGLPTLEIGERMLERSPGTTRLIDRLEAKGLVARRRAAEDRRQVVCRATRAGLDLLRRIDPAMDALDEAATGDLKVAEVRALVGLLDRVRNGQP